MVEFVVKLNRASSLAGLCEMNSQQPVARQSTVSVVQRCYDVSAWSERCHIVAGRIQLVALSVAMAGFRLFTQDRCS